MPEPSEISPVTFKLKPFPMKERGQRRVIVGVLSLAMATFNLALVPHEGAIALIFALLFGWSGLKNLTVGLRMRSAPEQTRAMRVSVRGLYKVVEGRDVARLPLKRVVALWREEGAERLWLCTRNGSQAFQPDELARVEEWPRFEAQLERCLSHALWGEGEERWREVQAQSHTLKALQGRPAPTTKRLITLFTLSFPFALWLVLGAYPPELLLAGYPELTLALSGGSALWLLDGLEWGRLLLGPLLRNDLMQLSLSLLTLWWVARPLERALGGARVLALTFSALALSAWAHTLMDYPTPLIGAVAPQIALLMSGWNVVAAQPPGLSEVVGLKRNALLWLTVGHIFVLSLLPPQLASNISVDVLGGGAVGVLCKNVWSLPQPLWVKRGATSGLTKLIGGALVIASLVSAVTYTMSLNAPLEQRVERVLERAPSQPSWRAQLATLCAYGAPCTKEQRLNLTRALDRDAEAAPLTREASVATYQLQRARLLLALFEARERGFFMPQELKLITDLSLINPMASFAQALLATLDGEPMWGVSPALEALLPSSFQSEAQVRQSAPQLLQRFPRLMFTQNTKKDEKDQDQTWSLNLTPSESVNLEGQRLTELSLMLSLGGSQPANVDGAPLSAELSWRHTWAPLNLALTPEPSAQARRQRLWLLVGEGEGESERPLALVALPLAPPQGTRAKRDAQGEVLLPKLMFMSGEMKPIHLWVKPLGTFKEPSAAQGDRFLVWRSPRPPQGV